MLAVPGAVRRHRRSAVRAQPHQPARRVARANSADRAHHHAVVVRRRLRALDHRARDRDRGHRGRRARSTATVSTRTATTPVSERLGVLGRVFDNGYYFDSGIAKLVSGPLTAVATFLSDGVDHGIIDGAVNGVGRTFRGAGGGLRKMQTGLVRNYTLAIVAGRGVAPGVPHDEGDAVSPLLAAVVAVACIQRRLPAAHRDDPRARGRARWSRSLPARRPELIRVVGYVTSAATFGLAVYLLIQFDTGHCRLPVRVEPPWMPALGIRWTLGVDGISLFMVALTTLLIPISLLASAELEKPKAFTFWMLLLEACGDRRVPRARHDRLLRVLRARARADVLLDRGLGSRQPALRGREVLPVHGGGLRVPVRRDPVGRVPAPARDRAPHLRRARAHRVGVVDRTRCRSPPRSGCSSRSRSASR